MKRDQLLKIIVAYGREETRTTVVFFLGGCTYTEIAALRWVGRQNKGESTVECSLFGPPLMVHAGRKFLIATTGIISGASLVESMTGTAQAAAVGSSRDAAL